MKILVVNDDGIRAPGILALAKWATKLGEVTVVAPEVEQSCRSQSITLGRPVAVREVDLLPDVRAISVDSTPADCVRYATVGLGETYDLVLSGINRGFNLGLDIEYSATVGAIYEAGARGLTCMAVSTAPDTPEGAVRHLDEVWEYFTAHRLLDRHFLYNVNIPANAKGVRITRQGGNGYADRFERVEGDFWRQCGDFVYIPDPASDYDLDTVLTGYISVCPMTLERTDLGVYHDLKRSL